MFNGLIPLAPFLAFPLAAIFIDLFLLYAAKRAKSYIKQHAKTSDYTILVPLYGSLSYLKNQRFLQPYKDKVIICTTQRESHSFYASLDQAGFRYVMLDLPTGKPNPWALFLKALPHVTTPYVLLLDGDTVSQEPLNHVMGQVDHFGYDIASTRVLVANPTTVIERLQAIEYEFAMNARKLYPWLTSGAAIAARTDKLHTVLSQHSLFFSGGDIEIGKLAKLLNMHVGHIPYVFLTDAPNTWFKWAKQRLAWSGGSFRHDIVNITRYSWRHPSLFLYKTIAVYFMIPFRWYESVANPHVIPLVFAAYCLMLFVIKEQRTWHAFLFPVYAFIQVMILIPLGIYYYFRMAYTQRNIGIIKLRKNSCLPTSVFAGPVTPKSLNGAGNGINVNTSTNESKSLYTPSGEPIGVSQQG